MFKGENIEGVKFCLKKDSINLTKCVILCDEYPFVRFGGTYKWEHGLHIPFYYFIMFLAEKFTLHSCFYDF